MLAEKNIKESHGRSTSLVPLSEDVKQLEEEQLGKELAIGLKRLSDFLATRATQGAGSRGGWI